MYSGTGVLHEAHPKIDGLACTRSIVENRYRSNEVPGIISRDSRALNVCPIGAESFQNNSQSNSALHRRLAAQTAADSGDTDGSSSHVDLRGVSAGLEAQGTWFKSLVTARENVRSLFYPFPASATPRLPLGAPRVGKWMRDACPKSANV